MLMRDSLGYGVYFMTFDIMKRNLKVADEDRDINYSGLTKS